MKKFVIPFGTCELNCNGNLKSINEKPEYDHLVNTGFNNDIENLISSIPLDLRNKEFAMLEEIMNKYKLDPISLW